jgi:hypothetical protein
MPDLLYLGISRFLMLLIDIFFIEYRKEHTPVSSASGIKTVPSIKSIVHNSVIFSIAVPLLRSIAIESMGKYFVLLRLSLTCFSPILKISLLVLLFALQYVSILRFSLSMSTLESVVQPLYFIKVLFPTLSNT